MTLFATAARNILLTGACLAGSCLLADVTVATLFQDHAVLQRDQPVPVWGRAAAGERVTVAFRGHSISAAADADGNWRVVLPPLGASAEPGELIVTGRNTIRFGDVVVGEVWLCSGQSNMEYPVDPEPVPPDALHLDNQAAETAAANFPLIRYFKVAHRAAVQPTREIDGAWCGCAPAAMRNFTAVGYFFARDIHRELGVPVGIIDSSWGGTPIESWIGAETLAAEPAFGVVGERWRETVAAYPGRQAQFENDLAAWQKKEAEARAGGAASLAQFAKASRKPRPPRSIIDSAWQPSNLYNGMIAPLVPGAFRGVLWYQGESNVSHAPEYAALFRAMIREWRAQWGRGDFPFYFVQLASYRSDYETRSERAFLREAQAQALALPATGMAVTIDNPDPLNLHPGNKQVVGHRLALIARAQAYGLGGESSGPVLISAIRAGAGMRLTFAHAAGLATREPVPAGFMVAGADRVFHEAVARIEGEAIVVASPVVPEPVAVRYAWASVPVANLVNGDGLPAAPFRTDDW